MAEQEGAGRHHPRHTLKADQQPAAERGGKSAFDCRGRWMRWGHKTRTRAGGWPFMSHYSIGPPVASLPSHCPDAPRCRSKRPNTLSISVMEGQLSVASRAMLRASAKALPRFYRDELRPRVNSKKPVQSKVCCKESKVEPSKLAPEQGGKGGILHSCSVPCP